MSENSRLASREHLIKVIEQYPIPMVISDKDDNLEYLNDKFIESYGYVLGDISPAEKWWEAAYPDKEYRALVIAEWRKAVEEATATGKEIETQKWDIRCKDGSIRSIEFDMKPIENGSVVTLYDVTDSVQEIKVLRDSEARFKTLLDKYPQPMVITDSAGNIEYFNKTFTESFGYTTDDISSSEKWWSTVYPNKEYRELVRKSWEDAVEEATRNGRGITSQKWNITCKDGSVRNIEFDMTPIDDGSIISMTDITEITHTVDTLRDSEDQFRKIIDHAPFSIQIHNIDGVLISTNKTWAEIWSIKNPEELIGKYNIFEDTQVLSLGYDKFIKEVLATENPITLPETEYNPERSGYGGRARIVTTKIYPLRDKNNKIKNFVITHNDITERRQAEKEAEMAAEKWKSTFDAISDSVCIIDINGTIYNYNSATLDMFGISADDIKKKKCCQLIHDLPEPIENCPVVTMQKSRRRESLTFKRGDRWLHVAVDPIIDANGEISCAVHIVRDVTEKNKMEGNLR